MKIKELVSKIVDSIDLEYNEVYTVKGNRYYFDYEGYSFEVWASIYQELDNEELPDTKSIISQSAQVKLTVFDQEGNERYEFKCEDGRIKISELEDKVRQEFWVWNN